MIKLGSKPTLCIRDRSSGTYAAVERCSFFFASRTPTSPTLLISSLRTQPSKIALKVMRVGAIPRGKQLRFKHTATPMHAACHQEAMLLHLFKGIPHTIHALLPAEALQDRSIDHGVDLRKRSLSPSWNALRTDGTRRPSSNSAEALPKLYEIPWIVLAWDLVSGSSRSRWISSCAPSTSPLLATACRTGNSRLDCANRLSMRNRMREKPHLHQASKRDVGWPWFAQRISRKRGEKGCSRLCLRHGPTAPLSSVLEVLHGHLLPAIPGARHILHKAIGLARATAPASQGFQHKLARSE